MIIVHENLPAEAAKIAEALKDTYGIDNEIIEKDIGVVLKSITKFEGYEWSAYKFRETLDLPKERAILAVTSRDLYADDQSKEDDWVFGSCSPSASISIASTARLKRPDSEPSKTLEIPEELYLKRLLTLAIHEMGHDVVQAEHFQPAHYVNARTGHELRLGPHCDNPSCVMYEIIDIRAPKQEDEYLLLGKEKRFDAGLDDVIERMHPDWFCDRCKTAIVVDEKYK